MHFKAGNGLIIPLKKRRKCELGIVIDTNKIILFKCRGKINLIFLHVRAEQLNAFHKLWKDLYFLASTSVNSGLSVKANDIQKQMKKRQDTMFGARVSLYNAERPRILKAPGCLGQTLRLQIA